MSTVPSTAEVAALLAGADDARLVRVVGLIDRMRNRSELDAALAPYRPRLALLRPPRPLTLERVLTTPFEDLLVDPEVWVRGGTRLPRHLLAALQRALLAEVPGALLQELREETRGRIMQDDAVVLALGGRLWPAAAGGAERAMRAHTDVDLRHALRVAGRVLVVGEPLVRTLWRLPPRPMLELAAEPRAAVQELLEAAAAVGRESLQLVLEILAARSDSPMLILEPLLSSRSVGTERERQTCAALVADGCVADLLRQVAAVQRAGQSGLEEIASLIVRVVSNLDSLEQATASVRVDQRELRRLKEMTAALVESRLAATLRGELLDRLRTLPDVPSRAEAVHELEEKARAAGRVRLVGRRLGLATKIDYLLNELRQSYAAAVRGWKTLAKPEATASWADLMDGIRIVEILFGSAVAITLMRELRAAP